MANTDSAPRLRELRDFGLIVGAGLALIFGALFPWIWGNGYPLWPWVTGTVLAGMGLVLPAHLAWPYRLWMKMAAILGWVNNRIILGVVFFAIIFPIGAVIKVFGRDPMKRKWDQSATTYREPNQRSQRSSLERPF